MKRVLYAALFMTLTINPLAAQMNCPTWISWPGEAVLEFQGPGLQEFQLTLADGTVRRCDMLSGGRFTLLWWASCNDATDDDWPPIFYVPINPDEPVGDGVFVFVTVRYYSTCD